MYENVLNLGTKLKWHADLFAEVIIMSILIFKVVSWNNRNQ